LNFGGIQRVIAEGEGCAEIAHPILKTKRLCECEVDRRFAAVTASFDVECYFLVVAIKPKPLVELNHFTVPVAIVYSFIFVSIHMIAMVWLSQCNVERCCL